MKCVEDSVMWTEAHLSFRHKYRQNIKNKRDKKAALFQLNRTNKDNWKIVKQIKTDGTEIRQQTAN